MVADFVDSVDQARASVARAGDDFPVLRELVSKVTSFKGEVAAVREAIDPGGEVLDAASPELRRIRNELRQKRQKLRGTLEQFTRGTGAKYLQDEVITERNGRFVLMVRAEHRGSVPGIVHGSSTTGATLFMEPAATVEINNDIVELEDREREEIFRILLELTDRFRARPADMIVSREVARELDVRQAKARYSSKVNGIEPEFTIDTSLMLKAARHPMLERLLVIDFNPDVHAELKRRGIACKYGYVASMETLHHAEVHDAKLVVSTIPDTILKGTSNLRLLQQARRLCPHASVVVTATRAAAALQLYDAGADFVLVPRLQSAAQMAKILEEGLAEGFERLREEQIAHIRQRDEVLK